MKGQMKDLLLTLWHENADRLAAPLSPRPIRLPDRLNKVTALLGVRRSGKTSLLFQEMAHLLSGGLPRERMIYLNFEDERLLPLDGTGLGRLLDAFYDLFPENGEHTCHVFLDEIQNVTDWPLTVRRFLDTGRVRLIITGSSAKLLSREIATALRGRAFPVEVWPYGFGEYLAARHEAPRMAGKFMTPVQKRKWQRSLEQFQTCGGFPEIVNWPDRDRRVVLQDYLNTIIARDIIERHGITNMTLLKYLIRSLLKNVAGRFSANKFFHDAKSQGLAVGKNTVHEYLGYLEDCYFAFPVSLFTQSIRRQNSNPRKIYLIDSGFVLANRFALEGDQGHLFENLVYLDLRRAGHRVHYWISHEGHEVDFISEDPRGQVQAWQVCHDAEDPDVQKREMRSLAELKKSEKIRGILVTPQNYDKFLEQLNRGLD